MEGRPLQLLQVRERSHLPEFARETAIEAIEREAPAPRDKLREGAQVEACNPHAQEDERAAAARTCP